MRHSDIDAHLNLNGWPARLVRLPTSLLVAMIAALSLTVLYVELPGRPLILHSVQKLGHPLVFGLITLGLFVIRRQRRPMGGLVGDYLPTLLIATVLGFMTEVSQVVTHRDPAVKDFMLDLRGVLCTLALLAAFDPRLHPRSTNRRARVGFLLLAGLISVMTLAPVGWVTAAYVQRALSAPTVFAPRSSLDLLLVSLTDTSPDLTALPTVYAHSNGERALRVPLTTRPYSGVSMDEPLSDWRRYQQLRIDVTNPTKLELPLHIRVQDRAHDGNYADRYEGLQVLPPQTRRTLEIPLSDIVSGPLHRRLDLGRIGAVSLYKVGSEGPRELWLSRVELR
jgi:hypothetical protein